VQSKAKDASQVPKIAAEEFVRGIGHAAQVPQIAVEEFVKGLSSEAGKTVVGFFSELVKAGFGIGGEKDKEGQPFSSYVHLP
jgi:hypothetical protein